jgi:hypothetical protein
LTCREKNVSTENEREGDKERERTSKLPIWAEEVESVIWCDERRWSWSTYEVPWTLLLREVEDAEEEERTSQPGRTRRERRKKDALDGVSGESVTVTSSEDTPLQV